jgi:hypothetical protein
LWNLLQGYDSNSNPLATVTYPGGDLTQTPVVTPWIFDQIKTRIESHVAKMLNVFNRITTYLSQHPAHEAALINYLGENVNAVKTKLIGIRNICQDIETVLPTATSLADFTQFLGDLETSINPIADVEMSRAEHDRVIVNDALDAISYLLNDIHPDTGVGTNLSKAQKKARVQQLLISIGYTGIDDSEGYLTVTAYIESQIEVVNTNAQIQALADYVDANVVKLPLERRLWAN